MPARPFDPSAPAVGTLIPDFSVRTFDGRLVHRRDFKGRRHLVICFAAVDEAAPLLATLVQTVPAWRDERAETVIVLHAGANADEVISAAIVICDNDGTMRGRFGVGTGAALFVADRYGEIVFHAGAAAATALPLNEVLPILEQIEMRCSL